MPADDVTRAVTGLILAGGLSRRMGGGDKSLRGLGGQPMLAHVIDRLRPQVGALVLNANGEPERFAEFKLPVVADSVPGFAGPLAGVLAGMEWAATHAPASRWIASAASDTPFFPDDLVATLQQASGDRDDRIVLAASDGETHPVFGLWPVALQEDLKRALGAGTRKILAWTDIHDTVVVEFPALRAGGRSIDPFFNANRPEELAEAEHLLALLQPRAAKGARQGSPSGAGGRKVVGIAGWKNAGKTTLATRLIEELTRRGYQVSSLKHAHHDFQIDTAETDSARHRRAGAREVAIVSPDRWAVIGELAGAAEPTLEEMLARLGPCDVVIVEGFKRAPIGKIEVRRTAAAQGTPLSPADSHVFAIAADHAVAGAAVPVLSLDDVARLADLVEKQLGLTRK